MDVRCSIPTSSPDLALDEKSNSLSGEFAPLFNKRTAVIFQGANVSWVSSESRAGCLNDSCFGGPRLLQLDQADINFIVLYFNLLDSVQPNITLTVPLIEASCTFLTHYQSNLKLIQLDCLTNIEIINPYLFVPLIILFVTLVWLVNNIGLIQLSSNSSRLSLTISFVTHLPSNIYRLITFMFNNQHPEASRTSQRLLIGFILIAIFALTTNYSANFHTDLTVTSKNYPVRELQDILNYNLTGIVGESSICHNSLKQLSYENKNQILSSFIVMKNFLDFPMILYKLTDFTFLGPYWEVDKVKTDLVLHRESDSSCSKFTDEAYEHTASLDVSHGAMLVNANSPVKSFVCRRIHIALESRLYLEIYNRMYPSKAEHYRRKCRQGTKSYSQFVFNSLNMRNYHLILTIIAIVQFISAIIFSIELFVSRDWTLRGSRISSN